MHPLLILLIGMATILGAILLLRLNAFLALIVAALLVGILAPGGAAAGVARVAEGFGRTAGTIGIVIALAAVVGAAMMESGAADRIVSAFLAWLGEARGAIALWATAWVLAIPVFFDTVFFLLIPLARAMHVRTGRQYLRNVMAIAAGAAATHTLVVPTPGPLAVAGTLHIDLGVMVLVGAVVSLPAAAAGLLFAGWVDRRAPVEPGPPPGGAPGRGAKPGRPLPGLAAAVTPIVLPVVLISSNTVVTSLNAGRPVAGGWRETAAGWTAVLGNPNLALLLAAVAALWLCARRHGVDRAALAALVQDALQSAGVIILITAAGGAFGATLQAAQVGPAVQSLVARGGSAAGLLYLLLPFAVASLIKIAQGSSTVAMITTAGMLAAMIGDAAALPFHPVYVATATAGGSLVGTWMNDSGFWVVSRMGGLSEVQTLRSWTPLSALVGVTALLTTLLLALLLPLR